MTQTCRECAACGPLEGYDHIFSCRRERPKIYFDEYRKEFVTKWPDVEADDWCLDFIPKEVLTDE